ncbi:helix-turn-helix domain-containing protein [Paractinoplanes atraurantiacus]|uniref:Helix-turn-helix n=1 Tax=Paractinoplanes atraurantiacus TaxID=1036182 RepID=A0A285GZY3_9ACTN|nr:helix-turn-helix transcriptional regulator [Actinoplanes atraurantiacus]SNY28873.1 Helix-turn-helix [Actinoplanes atraurantiacus]
MPDIEPPDATTIRLEVVRRAIAAEVRAEMARQNKSLRDLADVVGLSHQSLALRVRGDIAFRSDELVLLATALHVPVEQFVRLSAAADAAAVA